MKIFELMDAETEESINECLKEAESFLKENKEAILQEHFLYRGTRSHGKDFFMKKTRLDMERRPRDMPRRDHEIFDDYLNDKFGLKYRSFAKFATGNKKAADTYGKVFIFFPVGEYNFCFSDKVVDPYSDIFASFMDLIKFIKIKIFKNDVEEMGKVLKLHSLMSEHEFEDSLTVKAMSQNYFETYPTFSAAYEGETDDNDVVNGYRSLIYDVVLPSLNYTKTQVLFDAAKSQCEVMVNCKSYVMIHDTPENVKLIVEYTEKL